MARVSAAMPPALRSERACAIAAAALVAAQVAVSVWHLDAVPAAHADEPLLASAAASVADEGRLATPFRTGLAASEEHLYAWPPVHPLLLGAWFRLVGVGFVQARLLSVLAVAVVLALTFAIGRRLAGAPVGLLAVSLLLITRLLWEGPVTPTGITLLDVARVGRYDPLVALFGLAAVYAYLVAGERERSSGRWYVAAGGLAAVSVLSNAYGVGFLVALIVVSVLDGSWRRSLPWMALGAAIPAGLYLLHVIQDLEAWRVQIDLAVRGDLRPFDPFGNLIAERHRYAPGLGAFGAGWLARPGFWAALVGIPAALLWLTAKARRGEHGARLLVVVTVVVAGLLALATSRKTPAYGVATVPLFALVVAWAGTLAWRRARARGLRLVPGVVLVVLAAVAIEGGARIVRLDPVAARTTPYSQVTAAIDIAAPRDGPVLTLPSWWFAVRGREPRSWLVPLHRAEEDAEALVMELSRLAPATVIIDDDLRKHLDTRPALRAAVFGWLADHGYEVIKIRDATYGMIDLHRRTDGS